VFNVGNALSKAASFFGEAALAGDFNADGMVDAADYTVWRDGLGTTFTQADYAVWANNYGANATATAASSSVPEPTALAVALAACAAAVGRIGFNNRLG
jgi:hypothetical protein